jgi:uncharacterized protein (TIGR03437 family)
VSGSGVVRFSAPANTSGSERVAVLSISGQTFTVRQAAIAVQLSAAGVVNGASFRGGPVAAGQIVAVFGTGFGPEALAMAQIGGDRRSVTARLGETRVLFDGVAAPMLYAAENHVGAVVPFSIAEAQTTSVQVEYMDVLSNAVMLQAAAAAPAIFTATQSGAGQGAALNEDYTYNGAGAPAARGSIVMLYATGAGQTRPGGVDGQLSGAPYPVPVLPVRVVIGGVEAQVMYAGAAPGSVAGFLQINVRVPEGVASGAAEVVLRVGEFESPAGVTIAVR